MSNFSKIHNIVLNAAINNDNEGTIVLKPTKSPIDKIPHYGILRAIERSKQLEKNTVLDKYLDPRDGSMLQIIWKYSIEEIGEYTYYYLSIVNIQSDINYNGVPKSSTVPQSNTQNYSNTTLGIKSSTNQSQPSREFKTFEQTNVNSLQLYEGDIVLEGRYGNSLRFGSTIKNSSLISKQTTWTLGKVGDPIIILSNTKNKSSIQQVFRIEDINKDDSSIYLTSTQKIPLKIAGPQTLTNVKLGPVLNNLVGKQILVNSDRIVLNAKQEEIIISSAKGTVITSKADIIIESSSEITGILVETVYLPDFNGFLSAITSINFGVIS
jgi:hypothetical protein